LYDTLFGSASGTANAAAAFIWENGIERIKEYSSKPVIGYAIIISFFSLNNIKLYSDFSMFTFVIELNS